MKDAFDADFGFKWKPLDRAVLGKFVKFPLALIFDGVDGGFVERAGIWAELPLASKAVLPVLMHFARNSGRCWPSQEVLCALSGINSRKTVRRGVRALEEAGLISTKKATTTAGRTLTIYDLNLPQDEHYAPLHASVFLGGNWAIMGDCPTAQALYPVMRAFAKPRPDLEPAGAWIAADSEEWAEWYAARECDWCGAEKGELVRFSGIGVRSYSTAVGFLCDRIKAVAREEQAPQYWRVNFLDGWSFKPEYLNSRLRIS